jgi:predicted membrane chloride channel (bestrophin family)
METSTWDGLSGSLYGVRCVRCKVRGDNSNQMSSAIIKFEKKLAQKEKSERQKPEKILLDIANYLYKQKCENRWLDFDKALKDLSEYAKGLGVEL